MTSTGGTTGTISIHAHLVKNSDGIYNAALALNPTGVLGATNIGDLGLLIVHSSPSLGAARTGVTSLADDAADSYSSSNRGVPAHFINNEDTSVIVATDGRYSPAVVDDAGRQIMVLSHNSALANSARATQAHDSVHAFGAIGILDLGITNESFSALVTGANDDYVGQARNQEGQVQMTMHLSGAYAQGAQVPKAEDAPAGNGDPGFIAFGRRNDDRATSHIGANSDMGLFSLTEFGEIWTAHSGAAFFAITDTGIAAVSQNFAFGFTSKKVRIFAPLSNTVGVCVDHIGGTAVCPTADTAGDDVLAPGESISIDEHAITSVSAIAVSGTQTIVVRAFN